MFTSSIAVYGAGQSPMSEDMIPVPEDPYGIAKLAVEQELRVSHEMFGLERHLPSPQCLWGTPEHRRSLPQRRRNLYEPTAQGRADDDFGDGMQQRAFTHIDDVAPIIARSGELSGARNQVFNVGADVPYTVKELAEVVADAMGYPCKVNFLDARNEVKTAFSDHSKAERVFGAHKKTSLREGAAKMAAWVREHGARESNVFEGLEVTKNMPPSWAKVAALKV